MNYESPPARDDKFTNRSCEYQPLRLQDSNAAGSEQLCSCSPDVLAELCHCARLRSPWLRGSSPLLSRPAHQSDVVVYLRNDTDSPTNEEQIEQIHAYCLKHGYHITKVFEDSGSPSSGLTRALMALSEAVALIAIDLNRFVEHQDDRLRDLRPFIHHFFCHTNKHLVTIAEGIDTSTAAGQIIAVDALRDLER